MKAGDDRIALTKKPNTTAITTSEDKENGDYDGDVGGEGKQWPSSRGKNASSLERTRKHLIFTQAREGPQLTFFLFLVDASLLLTPRCAVMAFFMYRKERRKELRKDFNVCRLQIPRAPSEEKKAGNGNVRQHV